MKLILAISVVIIALSVLAGPTSANPEESTIKEKFDTITESVKDVAHKAGEKVKEVYEKIRNSDIGQKARKWFSDIGTKVKDTLSRK